VEQPINSHRAGSRLFVLAERDPTTAENRDRKTAANFSLPDSNGFQVALADYKGKVVLLNFWATWCGPCKIEIPWFIEFNKTYKDRGFAVLGVALDDDGWKSVRPYLAEKKMDYPVVVGNDQVSQSYGGIDSLPTTFIINRDGRVAFVHMGLVGKGTYEKEIRSLLGGDQRLKGALKPQFGRPGSFPG
jgi:thiol-disulfide isomerase/thioredoxin